MDKLGISLGWILGALGVASDNGGSTFWMPEQVSTVAPVVDHVFYLVFWISFAFFAAIVAVMLLFVVKYRRREGVPVEESPSHNTPLEITWTVLPLLLVIWIFWVGFKGYINLRTPPANSYQVSVTAQTWNWTFQYPNGHVDDKLHVPVNVPVELTMTSQDLIHSFYVPDFRVKMDVLPGKYTKAWFQATKPGEYPLVCAEYCGTGHSAMHTVVVVHEEGTFESWLKEASDFLSTVSPEEGGHRLYQIRGCTQCHSVDGSPAVGPTFKGAFGRTETLTDGSTVVVDENYIRESILEPQAKVVAGYQGVMPTFQGRLTDPEITALIAYIKSLSGKSD